MQIYRQPDEARDVQVVATLVWQSAGKLIMSSLDWP